MQPQPASRERERLESYFVTKWREEKIKYGGSERYGGTKDFWRELKRYGGNEARRWRPLSFHSHCPSSIFQKSHIARRKYRSLYNTTIN